MWDFSSRKKRLSPLEWFCHKSPNERTINRYEQYNTLTTIFATHNWNQILCRKTVSQRLLRTICLPQIPYLQSFPDALEQAVWRNKRLSKRQVSQTALASSKGSYRNGTKMDKRSAPQKSPYIHLWDVWQTSLTKGIFQASRLPVQDIQGFRVFFQSSFL